MVTTGTFGFLNTLFKTIKDHDIDCVMAAYDAGGNWRKKANTEYKANREKKEDAFREEHSFLVETVLPELGIPPVGIKGWEADDIIGTVTRTLPPGAECYVLTCDKDLLQLVNDKVKVILFSSVKKTELVDIEGVERHFGVLPHEVGYFKAIVGDTSDNITGIKGLGKVTAKKIIVASRESALPQLDSILLQLPKGHDKFRENLELIRLDKNVPDMRWYSSSPPETTETIYGLFKALEFNSFLKETRFINICASLRQIGQRPVSTTA